MGYCSLDQVVHEFHPTLKLNMTRDYGDSFEPNIEGHILKANAFVNASLARAYSVPLKSPTSIVVSAEAKIAAYFAGIAYSEKDEILQDKYEIAQEMLDYLVEADNPVLVDEAPDDSGGTASTRVRYGSNARIFTSQELDKW